VATATYARTRLGPHVASAEKKPEKKLEKKPAEKPRTGGAAVVVPAPTAETRWRCALCGNLTRFDVTRTLRVREYVHLDLGGEPRVDEREVLADSVERVTCRWCRAEGSVVLVPRPAVSSETSPDTGVEPPPPEPL
jgi:hypothetical protein